MPDFVDKIIVVDDCSQDGMVEAVRQFQGLPNEEEVEQTLNNGWEARDAKNED